MSDRNKGKTSKSAYARAAQKQRMIEEQFLIQAEQEQTYNDYKSKKRNYKNKENDTYDKWN